jgi:hypothetical protein
MRGLALVVVMGIAGCIGGERLDVQDPEIEIVRAWIAENSHSGEWDEIKWYPPKGRTEKLVRMKYRTHSKAGAEEMFDRVFWLKDGKLTPAGDDYKHQWDD